MWYLFALLCICHTILINPFGISIKNKFSILVKNTEGSAYLLI